MLLENPCGVSAPPDDPQSFPKILRHASEQDYYAHRKAEREAEEAQRLAEAEPIVAAVETRLRQGYPFPRLALQSEIHPEVLTGLLDRRLPTPFSGCYSDASRADAIARLSGWLDEDQRLRQDKPGCAPTPTHRTIYNIGMDALQHGSIEVLVGGVGIGKSWSAEALVADRPRRRNQPGAVLIELRKTDKNVDRCLRTILAGLRGGPRFTIGEAAYDLICKELRPGDLVILDEANYLGECDRGAMVDVIRDLWKDTGAGFYLLGNPVLKGKQGVLDNELYEAFASRARIHEIPFNSEADVEAWMVWMGLTGRELSRRFVELAARWVDGKGKEHLPHPGGLRKLSQLVEDVRRRTPGATVTGELMLEHLKNRGLAKR